MNAFEWSAFMKKRLLLSLMWLLIYGVAFQIPAMAETTVEAIAGCYIIKAEIQDEHGVRTTVKGLVREYNTRVLLTFSYMGNKYDQHSNNVKECEVRCDSVTFTMPLRDSRSEVISSRYLESYCFLVTKESMEKITRARVVKIRYGTRVIELREDKLQTALSDVWNKVESLKDK